MLYLSILLAAFLVYKVQLRLYAKYTTEHLSWTVRASTDEAFEGEDIYLYEEIVNDKALPLPFVKINTDLPEGLQFHFTERKNGVLEERYEAGGQSIYVVKPYQKISRRWRVTCRRRGIYAIGDSVILTSDLFGVHTPSMSTANFPDFKACRLVVLPRAISLEEAFVPSQSLQGDLSANHSLLTDPMLPAGAREYRLGDPMRSINWKSTARQGHLMVNIEDYFRQNRFHVILNMQSRDVERDPAVPSAPGDIERCISVTATLLDRAANDNMPIRVFMNTLPERILCPTLRTATTSDATEGMIAALQEAYEGIGVVGERCVTPLDPADPVGAQIAVSRCFCGKQDTLEALRMLSSVQMSVSVPEEKLFDHVIDHTDYYTTADDGGGRVNLIVVSAYFSTRMLNFHRAMEAAGVRVLYYLTQASRNMTGIPEDIPIYYAIYDDRDKEPAAQAHNRAKHA